MDLNRGRRIFAEGNQWVIVVFQIYLSLEKKTITNIFVFNFGLGAGDTLTTKDDNTQTESDALLSPTDEEKPTERRLSRDIGTQAYSIDFEKEKPTLQFSEPEPSFSQHDNLPETRNNEINVSLRKSTD